MERRLQRMLVVCTFLGHGFFEGVAGGSEVRDAVVAWGGSGKAWRVGDGVG